MAKKKKPVESDMYRPVKDFFRKAHKCQDVVADLPDDEFVVRVPRNLRKREIDVVGLRDTSGDFEVHLAEGKTFAKSHSFAEALNQLEDASEFGHYLWVFFPASQWALLSQADRDANEKKIATKGFGLLLVAGRNVTQQIAAKRQTPTPNKIDEVRRCMGKVTRECLPVVDALSGHHGLLASRAMATAALASTVVSTAFQQAGLGKATVTPLQWDLAEEDLDGWCDFFLFHHVELAPRICFQTDPFGVYLRDGRAVLWVWCESSKKRIEEYVSQPARPFGTHLCAVSASDMWQWQIPVLSDVDVNAVGRLFARGFGEGELSVGHRIELSGRSAVGLGREAVAAVKAAKKLKLWK